MAAPLNSLMPAPDAPAPDGPWAAFSGSAAGSATPLSDYPPAPAVPATGPWSQFSNAPAALGDYPAAPPQAPGPAPQPDGFLDRLDNVGRMLAQGATLGFGDEMAAGADALTHGILGRGSDAAAIGDRYDANLATERARDASIPATVAIPLQIAGGAGAIAAGVPAAVAKGAVGAARLVPGANALFDAAAPVGRVATNALARIPGASTIAPIAAEGAAYGGAQGFGDGEGGFESRLQSAGTGAAAGAVLAPVVSGVGNLAVRGVKAVGRVLSEAGFGAKATIPDPGANPHCRF